MKDKKSTKIEAFADGVVVRSHNRRIVIRSHKRVKGGIVLELYSVNKDRSILKDHVVCNQRMGMRMTGMGLSFDALRDISVAIEAYHNHVESIDEETMHY